MPKQRLLVENTRNQRVKFETAIAAALEKGCPADIDPVIWKAHVDGLESMRDSLVREEFELLLTKRTPTLPRETT